MQVINLFAGPGAGKSTTAAGLFHKLKLKGLRCEIAHEYAKDCVWEGRSAALDDQLYILAKQHRRLKRLERHNLDYVITDSPLLFSLAYAKNETNAFRTLVIEKYKSFNNLNFFIERTKPYAKYGRDQTEDEAKILDKKIKEILDLLAPYTIIKDSMYTPSLIMGMI